MQLRFALFQLGHGDLEPLFCKRIEKLTHQAVVSINLSLQLVALFTHRLAARSGGSLQHSQSPILPRTGR